MKSLLKQNTMEADTFLLSPLGLLVFLIAIPVALIIGLWIALAGRMKEIEGGEEDEASKY